MNNKILLKQVEEIINVNKDSRYRILTVLSNISSLLYHSFDKLNWLGFYIVENNNLVLGPFQGKVACTFIPNGKGVCGKCLETKKPILVSNVHEFEGHIACDSLSNSELVIPIFRNDKICLLLDIDSPILDRFTIEDKDLFILICRKIETIL